MEGEAKIRFIGVIETASEKSTTIRLFPEYCDGLHGLDTFSHVLVLYWFHLRDNEQHRSTIKVTPKKHQGAPEVGVFASRSPSRPNPIAFCVCKVLRIEKCKLFVDGMDAAEGSPIVDIKPYLPRADSRPRARVPDWATRGPAT